MALKKEELENNAEFRALADSQGLDPKEFLANSENPPTDPPPTDPPPTDPPPTDPPPTDPPPTDPPPSDPGTPTPQDVLLKEIFGDRFQTVEEAKQANIAGILTEVDTLRQDKTELEGKLNLKPKTNFADDEVAVYNEFVKATGVKNFGVFKKINSAELANMGAMDALVTQYILQNPDMTGKEPLVEKHFEKKYNVDPDQVDESELEINKVGLEADGASARKSLQEVKDKLIVPDPEPEDPKTPVELTPEEKTTLQKGWSEVGKNVSTTLSKLKIPIKNSKEPLLDYEVSESEQKEITDFIGKYAVENRMELNEANVGVVSTMVYNQLMLNKLPEIVHSVFEKARSMTEDQVHALYENPSPAKNTDTPPIPTDPTMTEAEELEQKLFDAEMGEYDK